MGQRRYGEFLFLSILTIGVRIVILWKCEGIESQCSKFQEETAKTYINNTARSCLGRSRITLHYIDFITVKLGKVKSELYK